MCSPITLPWFADQTDSICVSPLEFYLNASNKKPRIHSNIIMSSTQSSHTAAGAPSPEVIEVQRTSTPSGIYIDPNLPSYCLATSGLPSNYILPPMRAILEATPTPTLTLPGTNRGVLELGTGSGIIFNCKVTCILYCPEKKKSKVSWVAVRPSDVSVSFNTRDHMDLLAFQHAVADECNKSISSTGKMIMEGTTASPQAVNWTACIFKNLAWPKANPQPINNEEAFARWITEIKRSCQARGGVEVRMENPKDEVKKANNEELVARTIKRMEARRTGPLNQNQECRESPLRFQLRSMGIEASSGPDFTALDNQIDEIYQKYGMNTEYDRIHPVYLNPLDAINTSFSHRAMSRFGRRLCLVSAPNTIKYLSRRKQRGGAAGLTSKTQNDTGVATAALGEISKWLTSHPLGGPSQASPPSSIMGDVDHTLGEYLQFVGIASHKREEVLNILLQNDINHYKMFKVLTYKQLAALDLNLGVITKLCSNVTKYRSHLARRS
ncbi:hypothetical protein PSTT_07981 [Puccinia striiformis]|uniref:Uncharacterized protein n=1 Tax=Puccinia striiformis TaxID=27350 RepID=A0A2S4VEE2_9BASI|nr:hypothetical protein PSTT_07981 [Puccinia striiformis]